MVANALDDGLSAAVADAEPFRCPAAKVRFPFCRPVQSDVADDDLLAWLKGRLLGRMHDQLATGKALAAVVVGVADHLHSDAVDAPGQHRLPG